VSEQPVLLDVDDLHVCVDRPRGESAMAVDGVSFTLGRGEALGIVGESGSGKSLTALSIMGLLPERVRLAGGAVRYYGELLSAPDQRALRRVRGRDVAMIFQDPLSALNPTMRIATQLAEPLRHHLGMSGRAARERARELLEQVRIPRAGERLDAYPHEFSGGMRQRVMIAMALACSPSLLIADEPTTALDVTVQAEILALLRTLREEMGLALLLISHDIGVVHQVTERMLVMYAGQVVEEAPTAELIRSPQHPYTEALLACRPSLHDGAARHGRLNAIPGRPPALGEWGTGCRFAARCPYAGVDDCAVTAPPLVDLGDGRRVRTAHPTRTRGDR
jgi:oligopeptide/dipeptide ABC transporter ATP-binding protein